MKTDFQPNEVLTAEALNTNFQECADKANINHTQAISTITGLQDALDGKSDVNHGHADINYDDNTRVDCSDDDVRITVHDRLCTIDEDNINNLNRALSNPDETPTEDSDNLVTSGGVAAALDEKADVEHTHGISDVTDLQTILNNFSYRIAALEGVLCEIKFIGQNGNEIEASATNLPIHCSTAASYLSFDKTTAKFKLIGSSIVNNTSLPKTIKITHNATYIITDVSSFDDYNTTTIVVPAYTTMQDIELLHSNWREWITQYGDRNPQTLFITAIVSE